MDGFACDLKQREKPSKIALAILLMKMYGRQEGKIWTPPTHRKERGTQAKASGAFIVALKESR